MAEGTGGTMSIDWLAKLKQYAPDIAAAVVTGGATLPAKWGDSIAYWVGTTRSSANKDRRP